MSSVSPVSSPHVLTPRLPWKYGDGAAEQRARTRLGVLHWALCLWMFLDAGAGTQSIGILDAVGLSLSR